MKHGVFGKVLLLTMIVGVMTHSGHAQTWTGAGNNLWNNGANWAGGVPLAGADTIFNNNANVNVNVNVGGVNLNSMTFNAGAGLFTFNNNLFNLGAGGLNNNSGSLITFNNQINLAANQTWAATGAGLTFNGVITGGGQLNLAGTQLITFTANNTYTGETRMQAGSQLRVTGGGARINQSGSEFRFQGSGATVTVDNGAQVNTATVRMGEQVGAGNGAIIIHGAGSRWNTAGDLFMGNADNAGGNRVVVSNNGVLNLNGNFLRMGFAQNSGNNTLNLFSGASMTSAVALLGGGALNTGGNTIRLDGMGTHWLLSGQLNIGQLSGNNSVFVTNGAVLNAAGHYVILGEGAGSSGNLLHVTGLGAGTTNLFGDHIRIGMAANANANRMIISNTTALAGSQTYVGFAGRTNTLEIYHSVIAGTNGTMHIGESAGANNNTLIVSGSSLNYNGELRLGVSGERNRVNMTNSTVRFAGNTYVGFNFGANSNTLVALNTTFLNSAGSLFVGEESMGNLAHFRDSTMNYAGELRIGVGANGNQNRVIISNSTAQFQGTHYVGFAGNGNTLDVVDSTLLPSAGSLMLGEGGGQNNTANFTRSTFTYFGEMRLGIPGAAVNNRVIMNSATGTVHNNSYVGWLGYNNRLVVSNDSRFTTHNALLVGWAGGTGNQIVMEGMGSALGANQLLVNWNNSILHNGGRVQILSGGTEYYGGAYTAGDGAQVASLGFLGGTHNFNHSMTINTNTVLYGAGAVVDINTSGTGSNVLNVYGTLNPGNSDLTSSFSTAILTFNDSMHLHNGSVSDFDFINLTTFDQVNIANNLTLASGSILNLDFTTYSGGLPASFTIFNNASVTGTFGSVNWLGLVFGDVIYNPAGSGDVVLTNLTYLPIWDGGAGNANWTAGQNWVGDVAPINNGSARIIFALNAPNLWPNPIVDVAWNIRSLTYTNTVTTAYNISGQPITIQADTNGIGILQNSPRVQTISNNIVLAGHQEWMLNGSNLVANGLVSGNFSLTKSGVRPLFLGGASVNTFTGAFTNTEGIVYLNKNGALGTVGGTSFVGLVNIATLAFNQIAYSTAEPIVAQGIGDGGLGALRGETGTASFAGPVRLNDDTSIGVLGAGLLTMSGNISNADALMTKAGAGELILAGVNNTHAKGTLVSSGTLRANSQTGLNSGTGQSNVTVLAAARLGGNGRVGTRTTTFETGSILQPGSASFTGETLTFSNSLVVSSNTITEVDYPTPMSGHITNAIPAGNDLVRIQGNINIHTLLDTNNSTITAPAISENEFFVFAEYTGTATTPGWSTTPLPQTAFFGNAAFLSSTVVRSSANQDLVLVHVPSAKRLYWVRADNPVMPFPAGSMTASAALNTGATFTKATPTRVTVTGSWSGLPVGLETIRFYGRIVNNSTLTARYEEDFYVMASLPSNPSQLIPVKWHYSDPNIFYIDVNAGYLSSGNRTVQFHFFGYNNPNHVPNNQTRGFSTVFYVAQSFGDQSLDFASVAFSELFTSPHFTGPTLSFNATGQNAAEPIPSYKLLHLVNWTSYGTGSLTLNIPTQSLSAWKEGHKEARFQIEQVQGQRRFRPVAVEVAGTIGATDMAFKAWYRGAYENITGFAAASTTTLVGDGHSVTAINNSPASGYKGHLFVMFGTGQRRAIVTGLPVAGWNVTGKNMTLRLVPARFTHEGAALANTVSTGSITANVNYNFGFATAQLVTPHHGAVTAPATGHIEATIRLSRLNTKAGSVILRLMRPDLLGSRYQIMNGSSVISTHNNGEVTIPFSANQTVKDIRIRVLASTQTAASTLTLGVRARELNTVETSDWAVVKVVYPGSTKSQVSIEAAGQQSLATGYYYSYFGNNIAAAQKARVILKRTGDVSDSLTVNVTKALPPAGLAGFGTINQMVVHGLDYRTLSNHYGQQITTTGKITFAPGQSTVSFEVVNANPQNALGFRYVLGSGNDYTVNSAKSWAGIKFIASESNGSFAQSHQVSVQAIKPATIFKSGGALKGVTKTTYRITRTVNSIYANPAPATVVNFTMSGTAIRGQDYILSVPANTVTIPAGQSYVDVTITTTGSTGVGTKSAVMTINAQGGYTVTAAAATVTINMGFNRPTVTMTTLDERAWENGPDKTGSFRVTRSGTSIDVNSPLTVFYTTSSLAGDALLNVDYTLSSVGSVTIPAGQMSADVIVTAIYDNIDEGGSEKAKINLSSNAGYTVGSPSGAVIFIYDGTQPGIIGTPVLNPNLNLFLQ